MQTFKTPCRSFLAWIEIFSWKFAGSIEVSINGIATSVCEVEFSLEKDGTLLFEFLSAGFPFGLLRSIL